MLDQTLDTQLTAQRTKSPGEFFSMKSETEQMLKESTVLSNVNKDASSIESTLHNLRRKPTPVKTKLP